MVPACMYSGIGHTEADAAPAIVRAISVQALVNMVWRGGGAFSLSLSLTKHKTTTGQHTYTLHVSQFHKQVTRTSNTKLVGSKEHEDGRR